VLKVGVVEERAEGVAQQDIAIAFGNAALAIWAVSSGMR
jgi:hypothetical protein